MRKILLLIVTLFIFNNTAKAQSSDRQEKAQRDSILAARYNRMGNIDTTYITRPTTKWTITARLNVSGAEIEAKGIDNDQHFNSKMEANRKTTLSIGVSYLGFTLSAALNPAKLMGKYHDYELNFNSYGKRFGFDVIYQNAKNFTGWHDHEGMARIELPDGKRLTLINAYMASYELSPAERKLSGLGHRPDATDSTTLLQKFNMALNVRVSQARVIGDFIKKNPRHIIMCCDMNDVPGSFCYRMLTGSGLRDAYQQSGIGYLYTYNVGPFYFHLDHMLHSSDIAVTHFERPKAGISDHYPIVATFTVQ